MKVSLAQISTEFENKDKNKKLCLKFIKQAKEENMDFLVFPEMTLTGFSMNTDLIAEENNETVMWFSEAAKHFELNIGFGHVVRKDKKCENRFTIVDIKGEQMLSYAKIHPFSYSSEDKYYEGGSEVFYTAIKDFIVSPFICYDLRFPEIFQIASKEADLITVAANWPKSRRGNWITLLKARAIENQCYIAAVNVIGKMEGIDYSGDSLIIDPLGKIIADGASSEQLVSADIKLEEVRRFRDHFPIKKDRKEDLYRKIKAKQG